RPASAAAVAGEAGEAPGADADFECQKQAAGMPATSATTRAPTRGFITMRIRASIVPPPRGRQAIEIPRVRNRPGQPAEEGCTTPATLSARRKSRNLLPSPARQAMTPMLRKIDRDVKRFRQIVRGVIKKEFRKYLTQGELIGKQGKHIVSIPLPQVEIPRFRFGSKEAGGVGQGEGEAGEGVDGAPGTEPGDHILEAEVSLDELAAILGEELELPRIHPRGRRSVPVEKVKYSNIRKVGPESLRHFKRTFREALKRQIAMGIYNPERPVIVPIREDRRYRSWQV